MRKVQDGINRGVRAIVGSLLALGICFQALPSPHAPGLHSQDEIESSWVETGCRERHTPSFEALGDVRVQPCAACLGHLQTRATLSDGGHGSELPSPAFRLTALWNAGFARTPTSPPPPRGPPIA